MEDIIAQARELGKRIAGHPRSVAFMDAARAVAADKEAQEILRAYQQHIERIRDRENAGKPIEPEDKHRLVEHESNVAGNEKLKKMLKTQADYVEMMDRINHAIDEASQG